MVIGYLDVVRIALTPPKTDTPLVIDADAVLARPVSFELLKPVAWRRSEVLQGVSSIKDEQLP